MSDTIGDLIIRLKNATMAGKNEVIVPFSNFKLAIIMVIKDAGFIESYEVVSDSSQKTIDIKLSNKKITHIKRISKPGQRIYVQNKEIPRPLRGFGLVILSTPSGVLSGLSARKKNIGGELICEVW